MKIGFNAKNATQEQTPYQPSNQFAFPTSSSSLFQFSNTQKARVKKSSSLLTSNSVLTSVLPLITLSLANTNSTHSSSTKVAYRTQVTIYAMLGIYSKIRCFGIVWMIALYMKESSPNQRNSILARMRPRIFFSTPKKESMLLA